MNIRELIERELSLEDAEKFAEFAFGENFKEKILINLHLDWNEKHGDKLELKSNGDPSHDIPLMICIWKSCKGLLPE